MYRIRLGKRVNRIQREIIIQDSNAELLSHIQATGLGESLLNDDNTVNLDGEGLARSVSGGFWIASEGSGTFDDPDRPITTNNLLIKVNSRGKINNVVGLPQRLNENQFRFGLEGVASVRERGREVLYVVFQREWQGAGDPEGKVRIGRYETGDWTFVHYPLDTPESPNGGWVGLSEISTANGKDFFVIERDNQGGPDARIKRIYKVNFDNVAFMADEDFTSFDTVEKTLVKDLVPVLAETGGAILEKVEGLAVFASGIAVFSTDNDGVDDASGETQMIRTTRVD